MLLLVPTAAIVIEPVEPDSVPPPERVCVAVKVLAPSVASKLNMPGNKTLSEIYAANPITTIENDDLVYISRSTSDKAINGEDMIAQFSALASGVTSVALSAPAIFTVGGSPVTSTGTLALSLATQSANKVWAGPTSGSAAAPSFRSLVSADIPSPTMYAVFGHTDGNTNALVLGVSIDGVTFEPIGNGIPWLPPAGSVRDPSAFFYAPTGEWIIAYTHGDPGVGDFYYSTLGICKTRDGVTFEYLGEITFPGSVNSTHPTPGVCRSFVPSITSAVR